MTSLNPLLTALIFYVSFISPGGAIFTGRKEAVVAWLGRMDDIAASFQTNDQYHRPLISEVMTNNLDRDQTADKDTQSVLALIDTVTDVMQDQCLPSNSGNDSRALDFCMDPDALRQCAGKLKASAPKILFKHTDMLGMFASTPVEKVKNMWESSEVMEKTDAGMKQCKEGCPKR